MSYGQAVECDVCLKHEFYNDRLDRAPSLGRLPEGWLTISGDQGFRSGSEAAIFCGVECAINYLSRWVMKPVGVIG